MRIMKSDLAIYCDKNIAVYCSRNGLNVWITLALKFNWILAHSVLEMLIIGMNGLVSK